MTKIVRVQYTTKPDYAAKNKENIAKVMQDLREINNPGIKYATYLAPDEKTFMHFAQFENEEAEKVLTHLPAFRQFQEELKASGPETPPKTDQLSLVASNFDIFPL